MGKARKVIFTSPPSPLPQSRQRGMERNTCVWKNKKELSMELYFCPNIGLPCKTHYVVFPTFPYPGMT
jgi:hypothetical protein